MTSAGNPDVSQPKTSTSPAREARVVERARAARGEREPAARRRRVERRAARGEIAMNAHARVLVIVEAGALQFAVVHPETERLDEVQLRRGIGGEPDHVAGVRRDFGVDEDDGEHGPERGDERRSLRHRRAHANA